MDLKTIKRLHNFKSDQPFANTYMTNILRLAINVSFLGIVFHKRLSCTTKIAGLFSTESCTMCYNICFNFFVSPPLSSCTKKSVIRLFWKNHISGVIVIRLSNREPQMAFTFRLASVGGHDLGCNWPSYILMSVASTWNPDSHESPIVNTNLPLNLWCIFSIAIFNRIFQMVADELFTDNVEYLQNFSIKIIHFYMWLHIYRQPHIYRWHIFADDFSNL